MKKSMIIGIVVIGVLLSSFTQLEGRNTRVKLEQINETTNLIFVPHEPIVITHDGNFSDYGFPGLGTAEEPYIIQSYYITPSIDFGIYITSTTQFFIIRNCYVDESGVVGAGIFIFNVAEGTANITNNICNNNMEGIHLEDSNNATITQNVCNNNEDGIHLHGSLNATVTQNSCTDNSYNGIYLFHSHYATVMYNNCSNNKYTGIYQFSASGINLLGSTSTTVTQNTCNSNDYGIKLQSSSYNTLTQNTCKNNIVGISLSDSDYCRNITYNLLQENIEYGVNLDSDSDNNKIHHNSFIDNRLIDKTSQAGDSGENNIWYDAESKEGNYWSEWDSRKPYQIRDSAQSSDLYPLNEKLERINYEFLMFIPSIIFLVIFHKRNGKKKKYTIRK